jgi:CheY-like chemotaxis protein
MVEDDVGSRPGEYAALAALAPATAAQLRTDTELVRLKRRAVDALTAELRPLVLVVDDDREFRDLLDTHLQASRRCRTTVVSGGSAALKVLEQEEVELLLADLQMPGMDGQELMRRVEHRWPEVQRVLMTHVADTPPGEHIKARWLRKGRDARMLAEAVLELLPG